MKQLRSLLFALIIIVGLVLPIVLSTSDVGAAAWYSTYGYCKTLTITGSSTDGAQTLYQMKFILNKGSGADNATDVFLGNHSQTTWTATQAPTDIRFTTADNATLMDYWVESNTVDTATVWVEFDSIPASPSTTTFNMFYGLSGAASVSNGEATFLFFEGFDGSTVKWTGAGIAKLTVSGGIGTATNTSGECVINSNATFAGDIAYRAYTSIGNNDYNCIGLSNSAITQLVLFNHNSTVANHSVFQTYNAVTNRSVSNTDLDIGNWHIYDLTRTTTGTDRVRGYKDGTQIGADSTLDVPTVVLPVIIRPYRLSGTSTILTDWVLVRHYVSYEPTLTSWGAEATSYSIPSVATYDATGVSYTCAIGEGEITAYGAINSTSVGVQWDTDAPGAPYANTVALSGSYGNTTFHVSIVNLPEDTTVYYRAYATNDAGTGYGDEFDFLTDQGYSYGYADGEAAGYADGYADGEAAGYADGYADGEAAGYADGYAAGELAHADDYADGYAAGELAHADDYDNGYDAGYAQGLLDCPGGLPDPPDCPVDLAATASGDNVTLTWTPGAGADVSIVVCSLTGYPTTIEEGDVIYYGVEVTCTDVLDIEALDSSTVYYSVWSSNAGGLSACYDSVSIGGQKMSNAIILIPVIGLLCFLSLIGDLRRNWLLIIVATFGWFMNAIWTMTASVSTWDVYFCVGILSIMLALVTMIWPLVTRPAELPKQEELSDEDSAWGGTAHRAKREAKKRNSF